MQATQGVTEIDVRHRPARRELERATVGGQALLQITARTDHHRVVQMRLRALRHRVLRRAPEHEIIAVVERVPARLCRLKPHPQREPDRRWPPRQLAQEPCRRAAEHQREPDGGQVPEALGAHGGEQDGDVRVREVRERHPEEPHRDERGVREANRGPAHESPGEPLTSLAPESARPHPDSDERRQNQ